jgi:hypothetical protein
LPLLSLMLAGLHTDWLDVGGEELTVATYQAMGGMREVVNNVIEETLERGARLCGTLSSEDLAPALHRLCDEVTP